MSWPGGGAAVARSSHYLRRLVEVVLEHVLQAVGQRVSCGRCSLCPRSDLATVPVLVLLTPESLDEQPKEAIPPGLVVSRVAGQEQMGKGDRKGDEKQDPDVDQHGLHGLNATPAEGPE